MDCHPNPGKRHVHPTRHRRSRTAPGRHRPRLPTWQTAPTASFVGPTFDPEELAGRKVIALFDRAAARDFADVYTLAARFGKPLLLTRAAEIDQGFSRHIFADMLRTLERYKDSEIPMSNSDTATIRAFFRAWVAELLPT